MGSVWTGRGRRGRWLALFTVLLCVATASQVLADAPSEESPIPSESESASPSESPVALPSSEDVVQGLQAVEREEREHEELATPAAQQEREASRTAYAGLGPAEAQQLFNSQFGEVLAALNNDPGRFLSDAKLESPARRRIGDRNQRRQHRAA